jgi:hypothetical protein
MQGTGQIVGDLIDMPKDNWSAEAGDEDDLYAPAPERVDAS